jgi:TPR repeat protein
MLGLGLLFDLGRGVPADPQQALFWYERAGDMGLAAGAFNAAIMLDAGRGTPRDAAAAAIWYGRAAAAGDPRAQYDLAQLYEAGDGVPLNPATARAWYAAARDQGLTAAASHLERLPRDGAPIPGEAPAITAPLATYPVGGETVACTTSATRDVSLVWSAPREPPATRFFVEVMGAAAGGADPVMSGYTDRSAWLATLTVPGQYSWRVYAVDTLGRRYLPGPWQRFSLSRKGLPAAGAPARAPAG